MPMRSLVLRPPATRRALVVVEDDATLLRLFQEALESEGCTVRICGAGREALSVLAAHRPDVVLIDFHLADMNGVEFAQLYREVDTSPAPLVLISGLSAPALDAAVTAIGAAGVLSKPFDLDDFYATLRPFTDCLN